MAFVAVVTIDVDICTAGAYEYRCDIGIATLSISGSVCGIGRLGATAIFKPCYLLFPALMRNTTTNTTTPSDTKIRINLCYCCDDRNHESSS